MKSRFLVTPFAVSLAVLPVLFGLIAGLGDESQLSRLTLLFFVATVIVEALALIQALAARRLFSPTDPGYLTWTLITAFFIVRLIAEVRLGIMSFKLVPSYTEGASVGLYIFIVVMRYLYTLSDVLFIAALISAIRAYKSSGLTFEISGRDYLYIMLVCVMPLAAFAFRENFAYLALGIGTDGYIATYRLVGVFVGAIVASLSLIIRRYALQMGGGAVARVWSTIAIAGIARDGSFVAFAVMLNWWRSGASFAEQYLLWVFAGCWLIAALYQQEALPALAKVNRRNPVYATPEA